MKDEDEVIWGKGRNVSLDRGLALSKEGAGSRRQRQKRLVTEVGGKDR